MPVYSYYCNKCKSNFELFFSYSNYNEKPQCIQCASCDTTRDIISDVSTISGSVKKSDNELKTIGDLANRNRDKMSDDQKLDLYHKHNSYKEDTSLQKQLPSGMKRMKKGKKIKWT